MERYFSTELIRRPSSEGGPSMASAAPQDH